MGSVWLVIAVAGWGLVGLGLGMTISFIVDQHRNKGDRPKLPRATLRERKRIDDFDTYV